MRAGEDHIRVNYYSLKNQNQILMAAVNNDIVKSEILIRAQELFQQFGPEKTTMDEIASSCGKAKSTLYHYFKDKDQVFNEVVRVELLRLRQQVKARVEEQKKMRDKVKAYFLEFNKEIVNEVILSRIIKKDFRSGRLARKYFSDVLGYEKAFLTRIIEDGYDSDEHTKVNRQDIPEAVELLLVAFWGAIDYSGEKDSPKDKEKLQQIIDVIVCMSFTSE